MLISTDCTGKKGSVYECDRCKKILHTIQEKRYRITAYYAPRGYYNKDNTWDLCSRCYRALCRGIEKGVNRKDDANIQSAKSNN